MVLDVPPDVALTDDLDGPDGEPVLGRHTSTRQEWERDSAESADFSADVVVFGDDGAVHNGDMFPGRGGVVADLGDRVLATKVSARVKGSFAGTEVRVTWNQGKHTGLVVVVNDRDHVISVGTRIAGGAARNIASAAVEVKPELTPLVSSLNPRARTVTVTYDGAVVIDAHPMEEVDFMYAVDGTWVGFTVVGAGAVADLEAETIPYVVPSCWDLGAIQP